MKRLDLALILSLFAAFVLSACSIASGDLQLGLSCLNLELLIVALNIINLLIEIRRRR